MMMPGLINLLPRERIQQFKRQYFMRLVVVSILLATGVLLVHAALLLTPYLYVEQQTSTRAKELAVLESRLEDSQEKNIKARMATLTDNATYLGHLGTGPSASSDVAAVIAVARPGISLTGFTFTAPTATVGARLGVTGIASTREALRTYNVALSALPFVASADLPISAYAKETAIPFTITLTHPAPPPVAVKKT